MSLDKLQLLRLQYAKEFSHVTNWKDKPNNVTHKQHYHNYLRSNEWVEKRDRVLKRDNYTCQSCLICPADDVHHLTYEHKFEEFCFELISLCRDCHKRIHNKN